MDSDTDFAMLHIRHLAEEIGGRGSCTKEERQAADYCSAQMLALGAQQVRVEAFPSSSSTYRPYALAFITALLSTLWVWLLGVRSSWIAAALMHAVAGWGMLAETDFTSNWLRWLLPTRTSHSAVGFMPASGEVRQRVVLSAHIDTHRTPVFYSSPTWHSLFSLLVGLAFSSLWLGALVYAAGAIFVWSWVRWVGLAIALVQLFALALCIQAEFTQFSPGANDDASGVGAILALARRLQKEPLAHTEVWLALTGSEETSAYGMSAFLEKHAEVLGKDSVFIILDQVGVGHLTYLTADGLILKRPVHPKAIELAQHACAALPQVQTQAVLGLAYTDAAVATQRGYIALTLAFLSGEGENDGWHRMSDRPEILQPRALEDAITFAWQVMQQVESEAIAQMAAPDALQQSIHPVAE